MSGQSNNPDLWAADLPPSNPADHKYNRGVLAVVAGQDYTGAAHLCLLAARRCGVGMAHLFSSEECQQSVLQAQPGVIVHDMSEIGPVLEKCDAVVMGPGCGKKAETAKWVQQVLKSGKPCVVDADGLTSFADDPETLQNLLHAKAIITPHAGEYKAIAGTAAPKDYANKSGCTLVLKGHETEIFSGSDHIINTNAPATLATAGTGDVLSGVIGALLAKGMNPLKAASAGVWLHGEAAGQSPHKVGLVAEDLPDEIEKVLGRFTL